MKKTIFIITLLSSYCIILNAQQFNWGIRGGVNISSLGEYEYKLSAREDSELESKTGFYGGIFGQFNISNNLGIESGLFYSNLGGKYKENDRNEQYKIEVNPSYLQLPVAVFYKFNIFNDFKIYPLAGVYVGYGLSGKIKQQGTIAGQDIGLSSDYFDKFANRFDFGGTFGLNFEYKKFILGFSYNQGFVSVNKEKLLYADNAFNSNFRCTLSYLFK